MRLVLGLAAVLVALGGVVLGAVGCKHSVGPGGEGEVFEGEGEGGGVGGEGEGEGLQCGSGPIFGVLVEPKDPCNTFRVCGATATIADAGGHTETLQAVGSDGSDCAYQGAEDAPGTYQLTVEAPGYVELTVPNIVVTADACGHAVQNIVRDDMQRTGGCAGP